jgi:hypothetical protein
MSEDLTEKQPQNNSDILTAIKRLEDGLMNMSGRVNNVELDQRNQRRFSPNASGLLHSQ